MIKDIYPDENVITIFGQQYEIGNNKMKKIYYYYLQFFGTSVDSILFQIY